MSQGRFHSCMLIVLCALLTPVTLAAQTVTGAEQILPLSAAGMTGAGAFSARGSDAAAALVNPAAGALEQRLTLNLSYLALPDLSGSSAAGHSVSLGALFPTRVAVFSSSLNFMTNPADPMGRSPFVSAGFQVSKELWENISLGVGLDLGLGIDDWKVAGDIGLRQYIGDFGPLKDFTWGFALGDLGKSTAPQAFTPRGGVDFSAFRAKPAANGRSPFTAGASADLSAPGFSTLAGAFALHFDFFNVVALHTTMDFNLREIMDGENRSPIPAFAIDARIPLGSRAKKAIKALPDEGELIITAPARPLYGDQWAIGGGFVFHAGVVDSTPPLISIEYPEEQWISPNADGKADSLEFPLLITDRRYVHEWVFTITAADGTVVRTIRNKERRPENEGVKDFFARLTDVKSGVDIPATLRWDGGLESGEIAADGSYQFTISAKDDNGNAGSIGPFTVHVDNTPPALAISPPKEELSIFSPDGDGNKETFTIEMSGSTEDKWERSIQDAAGTALRSFDIEGSEPESITWDGKTDAGQIVPDGVYRFVAKARDRALNETSASLENIIVNTEQPLVNILVTDPWFSPNGDGVKDSLTLYTSVPVRRGIVRWSLEVLDADSRGVKTVSGTTEVPKEIVLDGTNDAGTALAEGAYTGRFTVEYQNGSKPTATSPLFTLDTTAPEASVAVVNEAFSPNGDGKLDTVAMTQKTSTEWLWTGAIRRKGSSASAAANKTFRFEGSAPARLEWDGRNDQGALSPDGTYEYIISATDRAGNSTKSASVSFELSTADTPLLVSVNALAFSPNGDGSKDSITISPQVQVIDGIDTWRMAVVNASGTEVRVYEGRTTAPRAQNWDGKNAKGVLQPDGTYSVVASVRYRMGNAPEARSESFRIDTQAPVLSLESEWTVFSPNGDGRKDTIPFILQTRGNDPWTAEIRNAANSVVKAWKWTGTAPAIAWDGSDEAGNNAPDGRYQFIVSSTDDAGNATRGRLDNLILDNSSTRVFLTSSASGFSPNGDNKADTITLVPVVNKKDGIEAWKLEILDERGTPIVDLAKAPDAPIPAKIVWEGKDRDGNTVEGLYRARLEIAYIKGDLAQAETAAIRLDTSAPTLSLATLPEYFSPDNDGVDDELLVTVGVIDDSEIESWTLDIREPGDKSFWRVQGSGVPAERMIWDGKSNKGELVQSATDYQMVLSARDAWGNESRREAIITVDVLVIRVGDQLRIQVPSIIFRENANDFKGLPAETVSNNDRVLKRIAAILNKFREYKIVVEGHANPVTLTATEERDFLKPLSEARASAVMEKLIEFGVARARLSYIGLGGTRTVIPHSDRANWWKNRRVEFILVKE